MCLRLSRGLSKVWHSRITSSAQRLGRKSRDNLSKTYTARSVQAGLAVALFGFLGCTVFFGALLADHRGENENAFFSSFNEAAKRVPCTKSGKVGGIGLLKPGFRAKPCSALAASASR